MKLSNSDWDRIQKGLSSQHANERIAAEGLYRGGERIIKQKLGRHSILNAELDEVIEAGLQALSARILPLLSPQQVVASIALALQKKRGISVIRLGDGELLTLAQGTVFSDEEVEACGSHFLPYAGVSIPDYVARNQLNEAVRQADIVGVPISRRPLFQNLFFRLANYYQWPIERMQLTSSLINYEIADTTDFFRQLLQNYQVLFIGNQMPMLKQRFEFDGMNKIVGAIPVDGTKSIPEVLEKAAQYEYDAVLVSGGVAASIICPVFSRYGKVAIDFGHMADKLLKTHEPSKEG